MAQSSFRAAGWDPILIIAQIISVQTLYYIFISLLLLIALALTGTELSLDAILDDSEIRTDTAFGWTLAFVWVVNGVLNIPVLVLLVQRAKLVLDFVLTLHFFHIVFVWIHTKHFPTCGAWWILQIINAIVMTLAGEWACMRHEMEPILVPKKGRDQPIDPQGSASSSSSTEIAEIADGDNNVDWVHIGKKKRKVSDVRDEHSEEEQVEEAPLTRAVGKAKKVLLQSAQRARSTSSRGKRYEEIALHDVEQADRSN